MASSQQLPTAMDPSVSLEVIVVGREQWEGGALERGSHWIAGQGEHKEALGRQLSTLRYCMRKGLKETVLGAGKF